MYEQYLHKEVLVLIDGRGYDTEGYNTEASVSLALEGVILQEDEVALHLDEISFKNGSFPPHTYKGTLNKGYVIGVFEITKDADEVEADDDRTKREW